MNNALKSIKKNKRFYPILSILFFLAALTCILSEVIATIYNKDNLSNPLGIAIDAIGGIFFTGSIICLFITAYKRLKTHRNKKKEQFHRILEGEAKRMEKLSITNRLREMYQKPDSNLFKLYNEIDKFDTSLIEILKLIEINYDSKDKMAALKSRASSNFEKIRNLICIVREGNTGIDYIESKRIELIEEFSTILGKMKKHSPSFTDITNSEAYEFCSKFIVNFGTFIKEACETIEEVQNQVKCESKNPLLNRETHLTDSQITAQSSAEHQIIDTQSQPINSLNQCTSIQVENKQRCLV